MKRAAQPATERCECGEITGERCAWTGPIELTTIVEHMPPQWRDSHFASGNRGVWPNNGALRLRVSRVCAALLCDEWTHDVGPDWRRCAP